MVSGGMYRHRGGQDDLGIGRQEESCYSRIELEPEKLTAWKKEVLGVLALGADGIPA